MSRTTIVAEIGINHNGDLDVARRLIAVSSFAGVDCVKFQKRTPDLCVPEDQKSIPRVTPWGTMSYLEYRKRVEFGKNEYDQIDSCCRGHGIRWTASVWDTPSLFFLTSYDVPFVKIPSACLTDYELLSETKKECSRKGIGVVLSTGMSTLEEIDMACDILKGSNLTLLHANSSYPAKVQDLNIRCMETLRNRYRCSVGYSGHEMRIGISVATVVMGASMIERHVTLDRTMWGSDHMASLEPEGLITFVRAVRNLEDALGDGIKRITEAEIPLRNKLRRHK